LLRDSTFLAYTEIELYKKAIPDYSKSISLNPQNASVYTGRGYAYNALGEYQKAKLDLIKSSELYKEAGDVAVYDDIQKSLKIVEDNIAISQQRNQENSETYYT
jgi:tetratricopeptide (TPR) repeat protein